MQRFFILSITFIILFISSLCPDDNQIDVSEVLYKEGLRKYILKDYEGAIEALASAYQLNDDTKIKNMYVNALIKQGNLEYENNDLTAAEIYYTRALAISEDPELKARLDTIRNTIDDNKKLKSIEAGTEEQEPEEVAVATTEKQQSEETVKDEDVAEEKEIADTQPQVVTTTDEKEGAEQETAKEQPLVQLTPQPVQPSIIQVQLPADISEFIRTQNQENIKMLNDIIEQQKQEREQLMANIEKVALSQSKNMDYFGQYFLLIIIVIIAFAILFIILAIIVNRRQAVITSPPMQPKAIKAPEKEPLKLLEFNKVIPLANENYPEVLKAQRLSELYFKISQGGASWENLQAYISELSSELKSEIIKIVEKKLISGEKKDVGNLLQVLMPLITETDDQIRSKSKALIRNIKNDISDLNILNVSDTLNINYLNQISKIIDNKTDRLNHSRNVAQLSFEIAQALADPSLDPFMVKKVGLIHDIGFLDVSSDILKKKNKLTKQEYSLIKSHTKRSMELISDYQYPQLFYDGILYHHERWDGSGYPEGLKAKNIPLVARIIAVADIFDALVSPRPYKKARSVAESLKILKDISGKLIDKKIFTFLQKIYIRFRKERYVQEKE